MNKKIITYLKSKDLSHEQIQGLLKKFNLNPEDRLNAEVQEKIDLAISSAKKPVKKIILKKKVVKKVTKKIVAKKNKTTTEKEKTSQQTENKVVIDEKIKTSQPIKLEEEPSTKSNTIKTKEKIAQQPDKTEKTEKKETFQPAKYIPKKYEPKEHTKTYTYKPKQHSQKQKGTTQETRKKGKKIFIKKKSSSRSDKYHNKEIHYQKLGNKKFFKKNDTSVETQTKTAISYEHKRRKKETDYKDKFKEKEDYNYKLNVQTKKKKKETTFAIPQQIEVPDYISIQDLAKKMNIKANIIIKKLFDMGMMVTINQKIDAETAEIIASEFNCEVKKVSIYDDIEIPKQEEIEPILKNRAPIVTVMGHVDHGKTTLLDYIRKTKVAKGEAGGITQKIGAYKINVKGEDLVFIDTPGHEAFTNMRARGAKVTDIVVLVVAADDGVMPQTVEAINHAKDAKVPIIVAVNKIDKKNANPEKVKSELAEYEILPQEWGGDNIFVNISALKGDGIDELLEAILLLADSLDLKADFNPKKWAEGVVLESKIDKGRGIVATVLIKNGIARLRQYFIAGSEYGRIRIMLNEQGEQLKEVFPGTPVEIVGFEGLPEAGDPFNVVDDEKMAKNIAKKRKEVEIFEKQKAASVSLDNIFKKIEEGEIEELKIIIKTDVQGMAEALKSSLEKLSLKSIKVKVIHYSVGAITENDVIFASASKGIIIGFNTKPTSKAVTLAEREGVEIRRYNVIYDIIEDIKKAISGLAAPKIREEIIGEAEVRQIFRISGTGTIAGCYVTKGVIERDNLCRIYRDSKLIFDSKIASLYRFKDPVKEVKQGYECGIGIAKFQDIKEKDIIETYKKIEEKKHFDELVAEEEKKEKIKQHNEKEKKINDS